MRWSIPVVLLLACALPALAQPKPKAPAKPITATDPATLKVAKGFQVELIYTVPKEKEGSWVCMTNLPDGRLVVSDQYDKGMYLVTPPKLGEKTEPKVEPMNLSYQGKLFGMAQGLCWAFDGLYVVVNGGNSGLYKVTSSKKNGTLDTVELLRKFEAGGGEHGPHAVMKHPDGKRLTVVCGNQTKMVKYDTTKVPAHWGEDHLLPRLPDGNGFMAGTNGPGGCIYNVTPDGKQWELFSVGFRNEYDAAYDANGELFTYDADMEWDFNTPWYRPTRVCQVIAGSEFGWRNGAGKYPAYYADNLPGICDIGPGSPTGVCFGTGAKFPAKFQKAMFICDWSYGKMYAVHMTPNGSVNKGTAEEFISGTPLPLTDIVVNEKDGAMYFTTGGRKTQSGLYRVTYVAQSEKEVIDINVSRPKSNPEDMTKVVSARRAIEMRYGVKPSANETGTLFDILATANSSDRFLRFSTRVALEFQDTKLWEDRALAETNPTAKIYSLLALVRSSATCPEHDKVRTHKGDPALRGKILESLAKLDFTKLSVEQRLDLIRVYHVLFNRFGMPTVAERSAWLAKFEPVFPTGSRYVDGELCQVFVYLQGPQTAEKTVKLLAEAPTQEEQMEYARALRMLKTGWNMNLRKTYFEWFVKAQTYKGGNSFAKFVLMMKADAEKSLTAEEKTALKPILDAKPTGNGMIVAKPREFVKKHTLAELAPTIEKNLAAGGRDFDKGRKLFAATNCFACHRFDQEGGSAGPDLSGIAGRFSTKDLLENVIDPNKEISDQYQAVTIDLLDGSSVTGRIVNLNGDNIMVMTDMLDPNGQKTVNQKNVDRIVPSKNSMMPAGLLDTLTDDEATDLMAYLLSMGKRDHPAFKKK
jgi:putative heme-binding domain-containing protein